MFKRIGYVDFVGDYRYTGEEFGRVLQGLLKVDQTPYTDEGPIGIGHHVRVVRVDKSRHLKLCVEEVTLTSDKQPKRLESTSRSWELEV